MSSGGHGSGNATVYITLLGYTSTGKSTIVSIIGNLLGKRGGAVIYPWQETGYLKVGEATHGIVSTRTGIQLQSKNILLLSIDHPGHDFINMLDLLNHILERLMAWDAIDTSGRSMQSESETDEMYAKLLRDAIKHWAGLEDLIIGGGINVEVLKELLNDVIRIRTRSGPLQTGVEGVESIIPENVETVSLNDLNRLICELSLEQLKGIEGLKVLYERCKDVARGAQVQINPEEGVLTGIITNVKRSLLVEAVLLPLLINLVLKSNILIIAHPVDSLKWADMFIEKNIKVTNKEGPENTREEALALKSYLREMLDFMRRQSGGSALIDITRLRFIRVLCHKYFEDEESRNGCIGELEEDNTLRTAFNRSDVDRILVASETILETNNGGRGSDEFNILKYLLASILPYIHGITLNLLASISNYICRDGVKRRICNDENGCSKSLNDACSRLGQNKKVVVALTHTDRILENKTFRKMPIEDKQRYWRELINYITIRGYHCDESPCYEVFMKKLDILPAELSETLEKFNVNGSEVYIVPFFGRILPLNAPSNDVAPSSVIGGVFLLQTLVCLMFSDWKVRTKIGEESWKDECSSFLDTIKRAIKRSTTN